ncbi:MAG: hypothetical protein QM802_22735 [Agriterribacter sp.]
MLEWAGGVLIILTACIVIRYTGMFGIILYWIMVVISIVSLLIIVVSDWEDFFAHKSKFWALLGTLTGLNTVFYACAKENMNANGEEN